MKEVNDIVEEQSYWTDAGLLQETFDNFINIRPHIGKFNLNLPSNELSRLNELVDLCNVYHDYHNNALANTIKLPDRGHYEDWYGGYINEYGEVEEEPTMSWEEYREEDLEILKYDNLDILFKVRNIIDEKGIEAGGDIFITEIETLFETEMSKALDQSKAFIDNIILEITKAQEHVTKALEDVLEESESYGVSGVTRFNLLCYNAYNSKNPQAIQYLKEIEDSEELSRGYSHMLNMNMEDIDYGIITHLTMTENKLGIDEQYKFKAYRVKEFFEHYPNIEDETKLKLLRLPGIERAAMVNDMGAEELFILLEVANQEEGFRLYAENIQSIDKSFYPTILEIFSEEGKYSVSEMAIKILNGIDYSKLEIELNSFLETKGIQNSHIKDVDEQLNSIIQLHLKTYDQSTGLFLENLISNNNEELWNVVNDNKVFDDFAMQSLQEIQNEVIYNKFEDYLIEYGEEQKGLALLEEQFPKVDTTNVVLSKIKKYTEMSYKNFHDEKLRYVMGNKINYVKQDTEDIAFYVETSSDKAYETYLNLKEEAFINTTHMYCEKYIEELNELGSKLTGSNGLTNFDMLDIYKNKGSDKPIEVVINCLDDTIKEFSSNSDFDIADRLGLSQIIYRFSKDNDVELESYKYYNDLLKSIFKEDIEDIISYQNSSYSRDLYEFQGVDEDVMKVLMSQLYKCAEDVYALMGIIVKGEDVISYDYCGEALSLNLSFDYKLINENVCIANLTEKSKVSEFEFTDHFNWIFDELGDEKYYRNIYQNYKDTFITTEIADGDWKQLSSVNGVAIHVFVNDEKDNMYLYIQKGILDEIDGTIDDAETIEVYSYENRNDMKTDFSSLNFENANLKIGQSYISDFLNEDITETLKIICKNEVLKGYIANDYKLDSYLKSMYDIQFKNQITVEDIKHLNGVDLHIINDVAKYNKLLVDKNVLSDYGNYFNVDTVNDYIATGLQFTNGEVFITYLEHNEEEVRYDQYIARCSGELYASLDELSTEGEKWSTIISNSDFFFDNVIYEIEEIEQVENSLTKLADNMARINDELNLDR